MCRQRIEAKHRNDGLCHECIPPDYFQFSSFLLETCQAPTTKTCLSYSDY